MLVGLGRSSVSVPSQKFVETISRMRAPFSEPRQGRKIVAQSASPISVNLRFRVAGKPVG